jgi:uncharacterized protein YdeI (YjbR/CyaY-like superfamily)
MPVERPIPTFFRNPKAFRRWFEKHHESKSELWVGFYKVDSGRPSITWPQSVNEALCFGWIDGIRKRIDEVSYTIRFTPRKVTSTWSAVNIRRVGELLREGRMRPAGERAFAARRQERSGVYSYEQRPAGLPEPYAGLLRKNRRAQAFFEAQPPSYRKAVSWWVASAKQEATRLRRLAHLIRDSSAGRRIGPMAQPPRTATRRRPDE